MTGILAIYNDVEAGIENQFNQWYNRQHVLERVAIEGFISGRRYRAIDASHRYFAWYETESTDVLLSAAYLQRLEDPTRWTREIMPHFRNMVRTVMHRSCRLGEGSGSVVASLGWQPRVGGDGSQWLAEEGLAEIVDGEDIVSAECWLRDDAHADRPTVESRLRAGPDSTLAANVVVHANDRQAPLAIVDRLKDGLRANGALPAEAINRYSLLFAA